MESLLAITGLIAGIASVWGSVICYRVAGYCNPIKNLKVKCGLNSDHPQNKYLYGAEAYNGPAVPNNPMVGSGQPRQVVMYEASPWAAYGNYRSKESLGLGVTQIIVGVMSIIWSSVGINRAPWINAGAYGIWGGILFIVTGAFGICASKSSSRFRVIVYMVLCIASMCMAGVLIACGIIGAMITAGNFDCDTISFEKFTTRYFQYDFCQIGIAMESLLAITGVVGAISSLWGTVLGCNATECCCGSTNDNKSKLPLEYSRMDGNQPVILVVPPRYQLEGQMMTFAPPGYTAQQLINSGSPASQQDTA